LLKMCALLSILFNFCSFLSNFSRQLAQMVRKLARLRANFNAFANKLTCLIQFLRTENSLLHNKSASPKAEPKKVQLFTDKNHFLCNKTAFWCVYM